MASIDDKLQSIRDRVKKVRRGIKLEYEGGLVLFVVHPPIGIAEEWNNDTPNKEILKHCVETEDGILLYLNATEKELKEVPLNVVQDITEAATSMLSTETQEVVVGSSDSASDTEKPSTELPQPTE